jgi:hypothetical protein
MTSQWHAGSGWDSVDTHASIWPSDRMHSRTDAQAFRASEYATAIHGPERRRRRAPRRLIIGALVLLIVIPIVLSYWLGGLV